MDHKTFEEKVYSKRPIFAEIVKKYGDMPFIEYLDTQLKDIPSVNEARKKEFLTLFESFLATWVSPNEVQPILDSISKNYTVSTADHHGVPWHPFFVNANLAHARYMRNQNITYACVLTASGVSLGNSSLPRSIGFHDESQNMKHAHFFGASMRAHPVYGTPPADLKNISLPENLQFLKETKKTQTFSEQITHMTNLLWDKIPSNQFARLAYLPLEELIAYILIHTQSDHLVWRLITTHADAYINEVANIQGAHDTNLSHGSMIFWHRTNAGTRKALTLTGTTLKNDEYQVILTPKEIITALGTKKIYPTYALSLVIVSCYFGITCMGGFSQVDYLAAIHCAYQKLTKEHPTSNPSVFCGEMVIAKLPNERPATLIDVILENNYDPIIQTIEKTPLKTLIEPMLPQLYKIIS